MPRPLLILFAILLTGLPAQAEDPAPAPNKPLDARQAADLVAQAHDASDGGALQALARKDTPDPWLVVDELCSRGAFDAAQAFAKADARADVARLPAYVDAARKNASDATERAQLTAVETALRARDLQAVIDKTKDLTPAAATVIGVRLVYARALALSVLGRAEEAEAAFLAAARAALGLGWLRQATDLFHRAALTAVRGYAWKRAHAAWTERLAAQEQRGDRRGVARTLNNLGLVRRELGDHALALERFERAHKLAEELEDGQLAATVLGNLGIVYETLGELGKALATYQDALRQMEAAGDKAGAARTLGNIGAVQDALGRYTKALSTHQRALELRKAIGDKTGAAQSLGDIGSVRHALGDYARALSNYERSIAQKEALGDQAGVAQTLGNMAGVYLALGDHDKALATSRRAHALRTKLGDRASAAVNLGNTALILTSMGRLEDALKLHEQARAELTALGRRTEVAQLLGNMGGLQHRLGRHEQALVTLQTVLKQHEAMGNRPAAAWTLLFIGRVQAALGRAKDAQRTTERVARAARRLRDTPLLVHALRSLVEMHLEAGDTGRALSDALRAVESVEGLLGGLGEERGASARETHATLFALGTLAAVREEDPAAAVTFLESGRAGALLDALGRREALRWRAESLSADLREADGAARAAETKARRAYDRAVRSRKPQAIRAAGQSLDRASEAVRAVAGRIQRDLKQQAGLYYPRAETIEAIQASLQSDQALVLYGLCQGEALALVLQRDEERVVDLGEAARIVAACEALDASTPHAEVQPALDAARALLVSPLALAPAIKQVLISPEGPLCYLPFGALFERTVAMTPSGTTHTLLRAQTSAGGKGILAIGSPDYAGVSKGAQAIYYRGRTLSPLPATRKEVETVGTVALLGADASEDGLRKALAGATSWRAVHFACHGLVNVEQPMLSSLALSRAGSDDGFVTALEILRMQIPADLAVLSACETGKGRIVKGEGIVGLTRAFMFAGAPRVICSLWKVDDEATQALMIKFYELWAPKDGKPGLGAAAALRAAQAHIRAQPKWSHPYYWAAWVLWGLPE